MTIDYQYRPKISVILTTMRGYNAFKMSMDNLGKQTFRDFELIIVNNGSEDLTKEQVFITCRDNRITNYRYFFVPKVQSYEASKVFNTGIARAKGKLCFFLHESVKFDYAGDHKTNDVTYLHRLWERSDNGTKMVITRKLIYNSVTYGYNTDDLIVTGTENSSDTRLLIQQDAIPKKYLKIVGGLDPIFDGDHGYVDYDLWNKLKNVGCSHVIEEGLISRKYRINDSKLEKTLRRDTDGGRNKNFYIDRYHTESPL